MKKKLDPTERFSSLRTIDSGCAFANAIQCPHCKSEFNHEQDTQIKVSDNYDAVKDGLRGSATIIHMKCEECTKDWSLIIQFHKGNQFIYTSKEHE